MPTKTEIHELTIQKAVERALSEIYGSGEVLAASRSGSILQQSLDGGSYNSSGSYVQYEVSGDICALYPVGP